MEWNGMGRKGKKIRNPIIQINVFVNAQFENIELAELALENGKNGAKPLSAN